MPAEHIAKRLVYIYLPSLGIHGSNSAGNGIFDRLAKKMLCNEGLPDGLLLVEAFVNNLNGRLRFGIPPVGLFRPFVFLLSSASLFGIVASRHSLPIFLLTGLASPKAILLAGCRLPDHYFVIL